MTCPLCGEDCRCSYVPPGADEARVSVLIDPDAADLSEQQFDATLEEATNAYDGATLEEALAHQPPAEVAVMSEPTAAESLVLSSPIEPSAAESSLLSSRARDFSPESRDLGFTAPLAQDTPVRTPKEEPAWRDEVASRVHEYRTRRRRSGRPVPSLAFDFEAAANYVPDSSTGTAVTVHRTGHAIADPIAVNPRRARMLPFEQQPPIPKVIEFPRPPAPEPELPLAEELAEPMLETPRILDAPEPLFAQAAESVASLVLEDRAPEPEPAVSLADLIEYEIAPASARAYAFFIDALFVASAMVAFGLVQLKLMDAPPAGKFAAVTAFALPFLFWSVYQWAFLFLCGATPGMQSARLCLIRFDGERPSAPLRSARAAAMVLSAASLGFGFAWSLLDEHGLCWHDRITRTHLVQL